MKTNVLKPITYIIVGLLAIFIGWSTINKINNLQDELITEVNLRNSLIDSIDVYKNSYNELVNEKLTLQTTVKDLEDLNDRLSVNQKELLERVKEGNKKNEIITAALIQMEVKVDSLMNIVVEVNEVDSTITFLGNNDNLDYKIKVTNVIPLINKEPDLIFEDFTLRNKQFIDFHWKDDVKLGYPVSFSISNSNPYFTISNIDSYAIPEIKKQDLKPTFWHSVGDILKDGKNNAVWVAVGAGLTLILTK